MEGFEIVTECVCADIFVTQVYFGNLVYTKQKAIEHFVVFPKAVLYREKNQCGGCEYDDLQNLLI